MHCGLCLPTCPTYDATKLERHSPRGRIALMRAVADERLAPTEAFAREMQFCLGCLACTSACPAGVNYAELFEHARAEAEETGALNRTSGFRGSLRRLTLGWLFMDLERLQTAGVALRFWQETGLQQAFRKLKLTALLPVRLRELEAVTPRMQSAFSADLIAPFTPARGTRRFRVALLTGCAQDLMFSHVNADTVEVLARNGCDVVTPAAQNCCGSLHAHNGEMRLARELARRQIDQFPPDQFDAIISNAAGCGSHLKHYGPILKDDPHYKDRAAAWDAKMADVHEWLVRIGIKAPERCNQPQQTVTYHDACHLCHGQKITAQPRQLLQIIPGLRLIELGEATWCCGSAGIYNLLQPEMSAQLLDRKLRHIAATGAATLTTGNPGCLAQIENGVRAAGLPIRVVHPITLLAEGYRAGENSPTL
jgi:glycolate oxidase iron-sulfur subunit